jgi:hypothetical protein
MTELVAFNRGAGKEYGLLVNKDGDEATIVPLDVKVGGEVNSKLATDGTVGGGEYEPVD